MRHAVALHAHSSPGAGSNSATAPEFIVVIDIMIDYYWARYMPVEKIIMIQIAIT